MGHLSPAERKRRSRKLRGLLLRFHKKLRKACGAIETPAQWYELTKEFRRSLYDYGDVLPPGTREQLLLVTQITDPSEAGIQQTCAVLQSELATTIALLPSGGLFAPVLAAGVVVVAVLAGAAVFALESTAVEILVRNVGCPPIIGAPSLPISLPGLELPTLIPTDGEASVRVPPAPLLVRGEPIGRLSVEFSGLALGLDLSSSLTRLEFDGVNLLGTSSRFDLGQSKQHVLVISCR